MTVTEKVAYIQGMFDGMELDKSGTKESKILAEVLDVLKEIGEELDNLDSTLDDFGKELDAVSDDLSDVEDVVFEDDDEDEDGDKGEDKDACCCGHNHGHGHGHDHGHDQDQEPDPDQDQVAEDDFFEANCPNCGGALFIDQSILAAGSIDCPACGQKFALSIDDDGEEPGDMA